MPNGCQKYHRRRWWRRLVTVVLPSEWMAVIFPHVLHSPAFPRPPLPPLSSPLLSPSCIRASSASASSPMDPHSQGSKTKFIDFPYVSAPHKNLMVDLVLTLETRLGSQLLPCTLPPDVQYYQNESGTNHASLHIRSGLSSAPVIFSNPVSPL